MSRVDKPTLRCDRCGVETYDIAEMARFTNLAHDHMSGRDDWDLCPPCWTAFRDFLTGVTTSDSERAQRARGTS